MNNLIYKEDAYKIIGKCMEVHNNIGAGFIKIVSKDALEPEFIRNDMFRTVIFRAPSIKSSQLESRIESRIESRLAVKVLLIIKEEELGRHQIAIKLGHKGVSGELNKQIKRLLGKNLIERTIPEKPNSRLQKYRLPPKALDLLNELIVEKNLKLKK